MGVLRYTVCREQDVQMYSRVQLTRVLRCLQAPHAVDIFRDFVMAGDGGPWSLPSKAGRGAIGNDMAQA